MAEPFSKFLEKMSIQTPSPEYLDESEPGVSPEFGTNLIFPPFLARKGARGMVAIVIKHSVKTVCRLSATLSGMTWQEG